MRLIDADKLLEDIVHLNNVYVQGRMAYIIDNQPTAYDVEAVIDELDNGIPYIEEDGGVVFIKKNSAIYAVRKGGLE